MGLFDRFKKKKTQKMEKEKKDEGGFLAFVLLEDESWDREQLKRDLLADWGLDIGEDGDAPVENLVFQTDGMIGLIGFMPMPVPNGEAEQNAASNYMWPQAVDAAKAHRAHFMVAVMNGPGAGRSTMEKGKLFVKLAAACCKQKNILGVYDNGTVYEPQFYLAGSEMIKSSGLPILNWIWLGLYRREGGVCGYTRGMERFGRDEMEILDADGQPSDVRDFLLDLVVYVLDSGVILRDGETCGSTMEDKHPITRSEGVSLPGMTLKIEY